MAIGAPEGKPFDAKMRTRFERLVEVSQSKGDSETARQLSPSDPFADFERWSKGNIFGLIATTPEMLPFNYVRSALKLGLQHQAKLGVNPFKFGFIGGSDQHTSLSTSRAEKYFGVGTIAEPKPERWKEFFLKSPVNAKLNTYMWEMTPGGLGGVWAVRTRAKPSGMQCIAERSTARAARARRCAFLAGGTSRPMRSATLSGSG